MMKIQQTFIPCCSVSLRLELLPTRVLNRMYIKVRWQYITKLWSSVRVFDSVERNAFLTPTEGVFLGLVIFAGFIYHWNPLYWGPAYIGNNQYGDAEFWWNGAIHFAQGIFSNNPARGFRPGYGVLSGLSLAVLGTQFLVFHKYFLCLFLGGVAFFYLHLRDVIGKAWAGFGLILLVFNPYTAEWIATTTTDGTGLLLHILALTYLMIGIRKEPICLKYFSGFAFFFSLGTLTRPLLTPFLGAVLLGLLFWGKPSVKKRWLIFMTIATVFFIPSMGWMTIQRMTVGEWSISSNDAGAFYAASSPSIQVWNNEMYRQVEDSAKSRLHLNQVDNSQLNQEFWALTIENYKKYWRYHLKRIPHHFWTLAQFTPQKATHSEWNIRPIILRIVVVILLLQFAYYRNWKGVVSGFALCWIHKRTGNAPALLLIASLCFTPFLFFRTRQGKQLVQLFLAAYWVTGAIALALVGGTWGSPSGGAPIDLNALGYRLGSQFLFVGDLLILLSFFNLYHYLSQYNQPTVDFVKLLNQRVQSWFGTWSFWILPNQRVHLLVSCVLTFILLMCLGIQTVGIGVVGARYLSRQLQHDVPYPLFALESFKQIYTTKGYITSADEVYTGTTSDFIWNFRGQDRSQILYYSQSKIAPFEMHPFRRIIEFPFQLDENQWRYRQGIFILRQMKDLPPVSNLAYYVNETMVRGFVPLSLDKKSFDLDQVQWFPLAQYASRLAMSGDLQFDPSLLQWNGDSGSFPYKRRFLLKPSPLTHEAKLSLKLTHSSGKRILKWGWMVESALPKATQVQLELWVHQKNKKNATSPKVSQARMGQIVSEELKLDNSDIERVDLRFVHVPPEGIRIYEFNLVVD